LAKQARVQGVVVLEIGVNPSGKVESARVLRSDHPALDSAAIEAVKHWVYEPTVLNGQAVPVIMTVTVDFRSGQPQQDEAAQAFFQERAATEGLAFQPATGYWANTYLPGDPALRVLRARLRDSALRLHDAATQPAQPFDPPTKAGLALYLNADRSGLDKPSRMLLQVGLKGSPRSGGHRPPMNVGLVLDLRGELATEAAADMRALALAFAEARQPGDRFSLIVAGRPGGVVVGHDKFKHGVLAVALDRLMTSYSSDPAFDLPEALAAALVEAGRREDPDAALGGSAVVLVTSQGLGDSVDPLEDLAHQGAVAGIPLSVVSVGSGAPSAELDRLALTGQGSRRQLEARADAPRLVEAELAAASDVVARAVRLRIRLAPGVSLVEIVGSRRLDEAQAQRVRETERSIDLRLSRILGIDSDRGDDEDGIQVVIPSFHSGDAHVILLDVVAEGAGALADVSVRYKDVAFLRNGVARASLSLPARGPAAGPLERNVLKNLLAVRLAQSFAAAGAALDAGDTSGAAAFVERALSLRAGLLERLPGIAGDPELVRHVAMLQEYSRLLTGGAPGPQIADSLRYAGRLMLSPRPALRATGLL
jgi:TonB family protein